MSPPSEPRRPAPRLRARAKVVAPEGLRPEVADALGGLERSIGEVADWEHQLASSGEPVDEAAAPADVVLMARVQPQADEVPPPPVPVEPVEPEEPVAPPAPVGRRSRVLRATPPPSVPPPLEVSDLHLDVPERPVSTLDDTSLDVSAIAGPAAAAAGELPTTNLDLSGLAAGGADPMATWVESTSSPHRFGPDPDQVRRRRNGRILSWLGAIILVVVAAWLLIPDHNPSRPHLVNDGKSTTTEAPTTTSTTEQLGSQFSVPTLPPTSVAPPVVTTPTTVHHSTTATTRPPATTTTVRPTTTTQAPVTTVTSPPPPPTTQTTCAIGDVTTIPGDCG